MKWSDFEFRIRPEMLGGKSFTLTVKGVEIEDLAPKPGQPKVPMPVLHFEETEKTFVLNTSNRRNLWRVFGDLAENIKGKRVTLSPCIVQTGKGKQDSISVHAAAKQVDQKTGELTGPVGPAKTGELTVAVGPAEVRAMIDDLVIESQNVPDHDAVGAALDKLVEMSKGGPVDLDDAAVLLGAGIGSHH